MSKLYLVSFAAIAAVAVGGVDFVNQSRRAAQAEFGVAEYLGTITGRFADHNAALDAERRRNELLAMAPKSFLPEAPEGWTRSDWTETAAATFRSEADANAPQDTDAEAMLDAINGSPTMAVLNTMGKAAAGQRDAAEVHVYEKPGVIVALRVSKLPKSGGLGVQGVAMQMVANNIEAMSGKEGYAVVRGVTYRLERGLFGMADMEREYRAFTGMIGKDIRISVRAKAEDADILALLDGVDYDSLNAMLDTPVEGIGSAAPELSPEQSLALASENVARAAAEQRAAAVEQERRLKLASLDLLFRHGKMTQEEYDAAKARLDTARSEVGFIAGIAAASETAGVTAGETPAAAAQAALAAAIAGAAAAKGAPADIGAMPATGGGLWGMISGMLGKGSGSAADGDAPAKVEVRRIGSSNCSKSGGVKRCTIGGN